MGYNREIFNEVQKKLYKLKSNALEELQHKKDIFYTRFPRAADIEKELNAVAINAARAVILGSDSVSELLKLKEKSQSLREELKLLLQRVDLPENYLEINYSCNKCSDEGFIDGIMCVCMKNMLKKESYDRLNRMSPLELSSFDSFILDYYPDGNLDVSPRKRMFQILDFCRKYSRNFNKNSPSLLMTGNTGLGKTHLSLAIAREVISNGFGVIYSSAQNVISKIEKEKFYNQQDNNESSSYYVDCDLLIIDDLGTEYMTSFSSATIYNIINSRIMMSKPTIISTNLSMRELEKNYTQRMVSRIIGSNIRLEFLGVDIRQRMMRERRS